MNIQILQLLNGARKAKGLTVIIDVFRAFSTACYAYEYGASQIIPVGDINSAYRIKEQNPGYLLLGERNEQKPAGFDFGNSPTQLIKEKINSKTIIHTTSASTQGISNATNADEIITGSFVNAGAIVNYIKQKQPEQVSLVCMGYACEHPSEEDTFCAEYIQNELKGTPNHFRKTVERLRNGSGSRFFAKEKQDWAPQTDFDLCLQLNRFNFVLKIDKKADLNYLRRID